MANSDNVLRGGLTPKHVDVPELLRVLDFERRRPAVLRPEAADGAWVRYDTPAEEFLLRSVRRGRRRPRCPTAARGSCCARRARPSCAAHGTELELARGPRCGWRPRDAGATVEPRSAGTQLFLAGDGLS